MLSDLEVDVREKSELSLKRRKIKTELPSFAKTIISLTEIG